MTDEPIRPEGPRPPFRARPEMADEQERRRLERLVEESERRCRELEQLILYLQEEIKAEHDFEEIVGQGLALRAVLDKVRLVAGTDTTVLILGETGTGKELIARAVHSASKRKDRPLIKINCAALPPGLLESELFGLATENVAHLTGRFDAAHSGTLFLDEVGELPPEVQARLLRVLQEREFQRVGGSDPIKVDVRIIATNRDLKKAVREKTFREDLYYRLSVFPIQVPPLRDRREDIPLLTHFLVDRFASRIGKRIESVSAETMQRLAAYPWPGNVRELENVLERAVILCPGTVLDIAPDVLAFSGTSVLPPAAAPAPVDLATLERNHITTVLERTRWVIDGPHGAAKVLGLHPNTLRSRLKKLGLQRPPQEP